MTRFVILSFLFMGFGFYELSGGSDFDPEAARDVVVEARIERAAERQESVVAALSRPTSQPAAIPAVAQNTAAAEETVTRASLDLVSFQAASETADTPETTVASLPDLAIDKVSISELATQVATADEPLSLAALETTSQEENTNAFAGNRVVASSARAGVASDIRSVKGDLVNMRSGPGTEYGVVDQLSQATEVEVLSSNGNGWVELRPLGSSQTGWIAEFLLTGG